VFQFYEELTDQLLASYPTSLEQDQALLQTHLDWQLRMVVLYRSEHKRILHSHANMARDMVALLDKLILKLSMADFNSLVL
jgi:hypothetical protein